MGWQKVIPVILVLAIVGIAILWATLGSSGREAASTSPVNTTRLATSTATSATTTRYTTTSVACSGEVTGYIAPP
ncbi:MAG: hypothetical protein TU35_006200 [Thermoproteus sp. AZ2]|jgi:hypothetical protein|uniref:Uncharacterized protein n=1 Tax=Thermoproteus sp. AZ2 TaxID=1609232 RepID=A0ACC6V279_9CREN